MPDYLDDDNLYDESQGEEQPEGIAASVIFSEMMRQAAHTTAPTDLPDTQSSDNLPSTEVSTPTQAIPTAEHRIAYCGSTVRR